MAAAHSPAVAMAVSLALVSAKERLDPDNATTLNGDVFSYLKHADLGAEIGNAKTHSETSRDTHILGLRGALEQTREALMANRCTTAAGSGGESSVPSHAIDVKALQAFIQTVRDFPIAMRGAARHAPRISPIGRVCETATRSSMRATPRRLPHAWPRSKRWPMKSARNRLRTGKGCG